MLRFLLSSYPCPPRVQGGQVESLLPRLEAWPDPAPTPNSLKWRRKVARKALWELREMGWAVTGTDKPGTVEITRPKPRLIEHGRQDSYRGSPGPGEGRPQADGAGRAPAAPGQPPGAVSATAREQAEQLWKIARRVADARLEARGKKLEAARTAAEELRCERDEARAGRDSARSMLSGEHQRWEREAATLETRAHGAAKQLREVLEERDAARQEALQRTAHLEGQVKVLQTRLEPDGTGRRGSMTG